VRKKRAARTARMPTQGGDLNIMTMECSYGK
jgi:hypothetical protein